MRPLYGKITWVLFSGWLGVRSMKSVIQFKFHYFFVYCILNFSLAFLFTNQALSQTEKDLPLKGITIICDLDFTFLHFDSRGELKNISEVGAFHEWVKRVIKPYRPVYGMDNLLIELQNKGAEIKFLSARPYAHYKVIRKYLDKIGFEQASLQLAPGHLLSKHGYKFEHIERYSQANPEKNLVLIGDNVDYDIDVFNQVHQKKALHGKILATYVRKLSRSKTIPDEYLEFNDAKEIAENLIEKGYLSKEELRAILSDKKIRPKFFAPAICLNLFN